MFTVSDLLTDLFNIQLARVSNTHGGEYHSACPACGGNDRFIVWPQQHDGAGGYWCRQCGEKSGRPKDNIEFLIEFKGFAFHEAARYVGRDVSGWSGQRRLTPPGEKKISSWQPAQHTSPSELWRQKAGEFAETCHAELLKYSIGLKWLESRGIGLETVKKYKLGWHPGKDGKDQYRARKGWGLPKEMNQKGKPRALWLPVGLVIPYFIDGQIQRVRIRRLKKAFEKSGPKYYIVPGSKMNTMFLEPERKVFVIVEAELDALAIIEAAGDFAGAIAIGSLANKPDVYTTKKLRGCLQILNALDYEPGKKDGARAIAWWSKTFDNCERWPVPKGKDPGEARQVGIDLREWVKAGLPPVMRMEKSSGDGFGTTRVETSVDNIQKMSDHRYPITGDMPYFHQVSRVVLAKIDAIQDKALALGWTKTLLYQNRGGEKPLLGFDWGLICYLEDGDRIGEVTRYYIEIIRPFGGRPIKYPNFGVE